MEPDVIYPVEELRKNMEAFAAARSLCLAGPVPKAVHRLRTMTRRIEAQITLLRSLLVTPKHRKQGKRLRKELKELRQGAGEVRDLDVQRKRIGELAGPENGRAQEDSRETSPGAADALGEGAEVLAAHLEKRRNKSAEALQAQLQKHEASLAEAAGELLARLDEASRVSLTPEELLASATSLVSAHSLLKKHLRRTLTEDELHTVRKAAKAARYLTEMMPQNGVLAEAAGRFEALQDAGGAWHDDLELARTAKVVLGRKHALTTRIRSEGKRKLRLYREALREEAKRPAHDTEPAAA